jgi:hypothetical protein
VQKLTNPRLPSLRTVKSGRLLVYSPDSYLEEHA